MMKMEKSLKKCLVNIFKIEFNGKKSLNLLMSYYSRLSDDLDYVKVFDENIMKEDKFVQTQGDNDIYNITIKNNLTYKNYIKYKNNKKIIKKSVLIFKILTLLSLICTFITSILLLLNSLDTDKIINLNEYSLNISIITFIILNCIFSIIYLILIYINNT